MLDALLPPAREVNFHDMQPTDSATRQKFRKMLREGKLDDKEIEVEVSALPAQMEILAPPGMEDLTSQIQGMFQQMSGGRRKVKKMKVVDALKALIDEEAGKLINDDELKAKALANVEQNGIVFLDEIDKIASRQETIGADVSRQGVQRDLLPLVEGTTVATKYGMIKTDHILFIASGAFHLAKPSDLIPELQGRFPIRVELASLSVADFEQILTATDACLTRQYQALLATERVELDFQPDGIRRLAEIAFAVNEKQENIGARRLYTVMERLLDEVSFDATKLEGAHDHDRRAPTSTSDSPASSRTTICRSTFSSRPRPTAMFERILGIILPVFLIIGLGYVYARRAKPDMTWVNRINVNVLAPALIFSALVEQGFRPRREQGPDSRQHRRRARLGAARVAVREAAARRPAHVRAADDVQQLRQHGPAARDPGFRPGRVCRRWSRCSRSRTCCSSRSGVHIVNRHAAFWPIFRNPMVIATFVGFAFAILHPPLPGLAHAGDQDDRRRDDSADADLARRAHGDVSWGGWHLGVIGALVCPLTGIAMAALLSPVLGLDPIQSGSADPLRLPAAGGAQLHGRRAIQPGTGQSRVDRADRQRRCRSCSCRWACRSRCADPPTRSTNQGAVYAVLTTVKNSAA